MAREVQKLHARWMAIVLLVPALIITACSSSGGSQSSSSPIKIGFSAALSGTNSAFGIPMRNALQIAVDQQNAKGGLLGRKVELVTYDDQYNADKAQANTRRLLSSDQVSAIFASPGSSQTLAQEPLVKAANKLLFNTVSSTDSIMSADGVGGAPYPNVFSTQLMNNNLMGAMATGIATKWTRVGILADKSPFGSSGTTEIKNYFSTKHPNVSVVSTQTFTEGQPDMTAQLSTIERSHPDAVLFIGGGADAASARKSMQQLGMTEQFIGTDGAANASYFNLVGALANGSAFQECSVYADPSNVSPIAKTFANAYIKAYGHDAYVGPGDVPTAAFGEGPTGTYDAAEIFFQAVTNAKSLDIAKLTSALESTTFSGARGDYKFSSTDHVGAAPDQVSLYKVTLNTDKTVTYSPLVAAS